MSLPGISATVFAGVLILAMPAYAVETGLLLGGHGATVTAPGGIVSQDDSDFDEPGAAAHEEVPARAEVDWLAVPPDPSRHTLWVPTAEWTVALALTIPLFMIDPAFVNTGTVSTEHFVDAWTKPPVWDTDGAIANYVLHPIMGAEAYLTVRNRDYGPLESFLFSTAVSVGWEYLFEAWVERPSAQDLLVTSNIGSLQGELRYQMRRRIARWRPSVGRNTLLILVDPVEALHRWVGKTFLHRPDDGPGEPMPMGSSFDIGSNRARVNLTMRF